MNEVSVRMRRFGFGFGPTPTHGGFSVFPPRTLIVKVFERNVEVCPGPGAGRWSWSVQVQGPPGPGPGEEQKQKQAMKHGLCIVYCVLVQIDNKIFYKTKR